MHRARFEEVQNRNGWTNAKLGEKKLLSGGKPGTREIRKGGKIDGGGTFS